MTGDDFLRDHVMVIAVELPAPRKPRDGATRADGYPFTDGYGKRGRSFGDVVPRNVARIGTGRSVYVTYREPGTYGPAEPIGIVIHGYYDGLVAWYAYHSFAEWPVGGAHDTMIAACATLRESDTRRRLRARVGA